MKTSMYVDGYNFYYGCFKVQRALCTPLDKWVDWRALGERLVGADSTLHRIHYFTAYIGRDPNNPEQNLRQETYLKAIEPIPGLQIHLGKHIPVTRRGGLKAPAPAELGWPADVAVTVRTFEEKGSDVNLAVHLLNDAWSGDMERAIVISNDTDLIDAIRLARRHIRVDVVSPQPTLAKQLKKFADYSWCLDVRMLRDCRMSIPRIARDGSELTPPRQWMQDRWPERRDDQAEIRRGLTAVGSRWSTGSSNASDSK